MAKTIIILFIVITLGALAFLATPKSDIPQPTILPVACTEEAKVCPDGSAVGRTGENCEFAECPAVIPKPVPTPECVNDSQCNDGNICNKNVCVAPIGRQCIDSNDMSCPSNFECVQGCGGPVVRENDPPAPYFCQLKGYFRTCPICLAGKTLISTPSGDVSVKDLQIGMEIWTTDKNGNRVSGIVTKTSKVPVPPTHQMIHLILDDGRELLASPGHPTTDGRTIGDLKTGDKYDSVSVISADRISYDEGSTYDILVSGETGFYYANGVLLDSTLR